MNFFSGFSDETKLKILLSLMEKPRSVNEIYNYVGKEKMTLSAISHQLRQLSDTGIVFSERNGKEKIFQLSNDFCWCIIRDAYKHFSGEKNVECEACNKIKFNDKNKRRKI
ncbi:winged helix-turn-helix transcriptional regulator [Candidatus Pacearchaeota archaeon]|nr:winged helix-turn-helix transcriptional regulator [Candidatus Pacearchaeota archaeon]